MKQYDYIICGAGCAGLSLAYRLCDPKFQQKRILVLDKEPKTSNDRTWSFWIDKPHLFDNIVTKKWTHINFYGNKDLERLDISPYTYQTIQGIDFYNFTLQKISECDHIDIKYESVERITQLEKNQVKVSNSHEEYIGTMVFSSIVSHYPTEDLHFVWQHFKGWIIETDTNQFDIDTATFMDFRIAQEGETRFVYVLPFAGNRALIEATIFSKNKWNSKEYDPIIINYIDSYLNLDNYEIIEEEEGAIPMTTSRFYDIKSNSIIPIGTLSDSVKPSSGYAFIRIQEEVDQIIEQLTYKRAVDTSRKSRFILYDRTLLDVIIRNKRSAKHIFSLMFQKNTSQQIFAFLNEKTSLFQEINIFRTLPFWPFLTSFFNSNVLNKTKS